MLNKIKTLVKSDNGLVLMGNLSASALGLFTFMLLTRGLSKTDFGAWTLFISASGLLDLMRTGMVRQALVRSLAIEKVESKHPGILSAAGVLAGLITFIFATLIFGIHLSVDTSQWSLHLFFKYYPVLAVISLPSSFDTWKSHAQNQYGRMNAIRLFVNVLFILSVTIGLFSEFELVHFLWVYLGAQALVSIYSILSNLWKTPWLSATKSQVYSLFQYGRHSLATLAGSNLLKSADSLLIGAFLGTGAVAIYAIPLKVLDLMEIPLRGFVMTSFNKLSRAHAEGKHHDFKAIVRRQVSQLTILFLPVAIFILFMPDLVIQVLGGDGYQDSSLVLRILLIPMILLPLDKFVGISFDSIGQPGINALKVWIMVIVNILGDLIVLYFFQSLWLVALVTVLNILMGIVFGLINHPHIDFAIFKLRPSAYQKSSIRFQSAKTEA
ncbi:MAG: oligosaccharide flippase family protein [Marinoscillum sp.]